MAEIRHQYRDGFNYEQHTLCGAPNTPWAADAIPCEPCAQKAKERAAAKAARARAIQEAKEEKLRGMDNVKIYDED
jgi:hypothetical protein